MSTSEGSGAASQAAGVSAFLDYWLDNSDMLDHRSRFFVCFSLLFEPTLIAECLTPGPSYAIKP